MLQKYKVGLALITFFLVSGVVQAATQWTSSNKVSRYYPKADTFIQTEGTMINPAGCGSGNYYGLDSTHPQYEEYQRVLLTALASGKKVTIAVHSDTGDCVGAYPMIDRIWIDQ